ncbi:MAG TPA: hypothetical protein PLB16_11915 [bacterium]|nr:hypothetical protein [bacterium]
MKKLIFAIMIVSLVFAVSCGSDTKSTKNDNETVSDNETNDKYFCTTDMGIQHKISRVCFQAR